MTAVESYDRFNRMKYHPDFHTNQGKPWSTEELQYLCRFYDHDHGRAIAFALGRTETTLRTKVDLLKRKGMFEYYKHLWNQNFDRGGDEADAGNEKYSY
ncbi:DNA-entry nuclease [Brevibacillus laterosporus]|uniref:DNA-entry nuclease n=1 Tax=Brevibacillus laterosporus TaxID=1465 RepID=UPI003D1EBB6D